MSRRIVLTLHGIGEPPEHVEPGERPYWLTSQAFDTLLDLIDARGGSERFAITFDDGNASDLIAAERLQERGHHARFFVLTGRIGQPHYLDRADLRTLRKMGMAVGLHGRDHLDWRQLDPASLAHQIDDAREQLSEALGEGVREVAIPLGAYNRQVMGWLLAKDYSHIHTSDGGIANLANRIINRNSLRSDMSPEQMAAILDGARQPGSLVLRSMSQFWRRNLA